MALIKAVPIFATIAFLYSFNFFADENNIKKIEELSATCDTELVFALRLGQNSEQRKSFEKNLKELVLACQNLQKDINANNLKINIISDVNFINQSFEKIKKMRTFAQNHYLFDDIKYSFSELNQKIKDVQECKLYTQEKPDPLPRSLDYLLELEYLLEKLSNQNFEITFYKEKNSRIRAINESTVSRIVFLAGKIQTAAIKQKLQIPQISSDANRMVQSYQKIINDHTGNVENSIREWTIAFEDMKADLKKMKEEGISIPSK